MFPAFKITVPNTHTSEISREYQIYTFIWSLAKIPYFIQNKAAFLVSISSQDPEEGTTM
jgi:hypothetical protein